jgi:serine/threonine protein kinase
MMSVPGTTDELFDLIRKSGLIEENRLRDYRQQLSKASGFPTSASLLATRMINDGLLTHLQAGLLLKGKSKNFFVACKYKLLEHICTGGMGQVFLCEHRRLGSRVAIKILPTERAEDDANLHRFYREARAIAVLDHPNIVRAHDIDRDREMHFLVMEYVEGTNLQELVNRWGPLPVGRAVDYAIQAACGLHHAHENGLIHRDVKPGNLLLDRNGQIKLLDLGLARFFADAEDHLTQELGGRKLIGTADFLAPEQAIDSTSADARSDLYGLGTALYFMLAGQAPFHAAPTVAEKLMKHQNGQPKSICECRPDVPRELAAVIDRAMAKNPNDRFQTGLELVDALMPFLPAVVPLPNPMEMPQLCLAARQSDQLSDCLPVAELSSARLQRSMVTSQGFFQPFSGVMPSPLTTFRWTLLVAGICVGGLILGVVVGKLASAASASPAVVEIGSDQFQK